MSLDLMVNLVVMSWLNDKNLSSSEASILLYISLYLCCLTRKDAVMEEAGIHLHRGGRNTVITCSARRAGKSAGVKIDLL